MRDTAHLGKRQCCPSSQSSELLLDLVSHFHRSCTNDRARCCWQELPTRVLARSASGASPRYSRTALINMHHHVRQLSVSIVRTVESDICRCISPRGFRSIQRTITGLGGIGLAPGVSEGVELCLGDLSGWLATEDDVIVVGVKRW